MLVAQLCLTLWDPVGLWHTRLLCPWDSLGKNTGVGSLSLLQGIFPTQGSSPGLPHCRQILYHLSHQGNPRILEWVAYPFSRDMTVVLSNLPASKLILHLKFTWRLVRGQAKIVCPSKAYYEVHFVRFVSISLHPERQCGVMEHWFD